jgi:hypothetical protein
MVAMRHPLANWRSRVRALLLLWLGSATAAAAELPERHTVLATRNHVAPLGRVGTFNAGVRQIDDRGRFLIAALLSDDSTAVFWAGDEGIDVVWRGEPGRQPFVDQWSAVASPDGVHVLALSDPQPDSSARNQLRQLRPQPSRVRFSTGAITSDGWEVLTLETIVGVNDAGDVLLGAGVRAAGTDTQSRAALIILHATGAPAVVAGEGGEFSDAARFDSLAPVGIDEGGVATFTGFRNRPGSNGFAGIFQADATGVRPLLTSDDTRPDGESIGSPVALAANRRGEVLLQLYSSPPADDCAMYRTENGTLIRIRACRDVDPAGRTTDSSSGRLNARGDVLLTTHWQDERIPGRSTPRRGMVLYPAGGPARVVADDDNSGLLNDNGDVSVDVISGGDPTGVARWNDGALHPLLTSDTRLPGGAQPLSLGLRTACLAEDGRVGALARFADGQQAWVCVDGDGPHVATLTTASPATIQGGLGCTFTDDELIVSGSPLFGGGVARVGAHGTWTIVQRGDALPNGAEVTDYRAVSASRDGTLLVVVSTAQGREVLRQRPGGAPELLDFDLGDGWQFDAESAGIADDGTAVAIGTARFDAEARSELMLLARDDTTTRILARSDDRPSPSAGLLVVRGARVLVEAEHLFGYGHRYRLFDLDSGTEREVLAPDTHPEFPDPSIVGVVDLSRNGVMLLRSEGPSLPSASDYWLLRDDRLEPLHHQEAAELPWIQPWRINAAGDLLSFEYSVAIARLTRAGGAITGRCPGAATTASGSAGGCQVAPAPAIAWPLLGVLLLWLPRLLAARPDRLTRRA